MRCRASCERSERNEKRERSGGRRMRERERASGAKEAKRRGLSR
jgi:hypothetical protein